MKWLMRLFYTLALFAAWSVLAYFYVDYTLSSPQRHEPVQFEINPGSSTADIGRMLKDENLIRHDWFFSTYLFLTGNRRLQAGVYEVSPEMDIDSMLDMFTKGRQNTYTVTIPEGFTIDQIGSAIDKKGKVSKEEFLKAVDEGEYDFDFIQNIPEKENRTYRLEGYLFPSTYNIPKTANAEDVVKLMLGQFAARMEKSGALQRLQERNMTVDEWVTVASIVEREGQAEHEFPKIAGVIQNRLDKNMRLQVDATIQYALGEQKERLYYKDLKLDSPYNTYRIDGLPPGPIANPGERALTAVLEPEQHSYLYYVTKKDGTGEHYFAETYEQHRNFIAQSNKTQTQNSGQ
ncbi:endolytic transglycosylase MltG [Desmospora profundinema]|uniref:Endolytic murein transglycosylase n=1 Tax=Desmospora profundinema TaxID=1571184 RepID=A0ABU1IKV7_9BACL|nr:endolytic transglycosylase MltG [Desmospora profundinema]MDR6225187.1 UPF0755 protein [Desmospora profundinema]